MKDLRDTRTWDSPLSEDEKAWLRDRDKHAEIAANEARFAGEELESSGPTADDYDKWTKAELVAEADGREPAVDSSGNKPDIIGRLREWDAEHPEAV